MVKFKISDIMLRFRFRFMTVLVWIIFLCIISSACDKFLYLDAPRTQIVNTNAFAHESTANSVLAGVYYSLFNNNGIFNGFYTSILPGLSADELNASGIGYTDFQTNTLLPNSSQVSQLWQQAYHIIYQTNALIKGVTTSELNTEAKNQLIGEALFLRAYTYLYLVNFYGDVPLVLSSELDQNQDKSRAPAIQVYGAIIEDLNNSRMMLRNDYAISNWERVRANKWAASALLARVYLYTRNWKDAEIMASEVIANTSLFGLPDDLDDVFIKNSKEAIWQLLPYNGNYTFLGQQFIPAGVTPPNYFLTSHLLDAFGPGDKRMTHWIDSVVVNNSLYFYPYKYKLRTSTTEIKDEYCMQLRLAEQYLIRAEARIEQGDLNRGRQDINVIRSRAGLGHVQEDQKDVLLDCVYRERQIELFSEQAHRWFDLKRTSRVDEALESIKSPNWQSTDTLYPIPDLELGKNPNLRQNEGY